MKKIFVFLFPMILNANSLEISKLRTDLYSKSTTHTLKKVELSLEFEGDSLVPNEKKIIDSVYTVISGFFYEDLFTERGKNNFKNTLEKFIEKKYKLQIDNIYILSLSGVEKFDIEELKRFLQSTDVKEKNTSAIIENTINNLEIPKVQIPQVDMLFTGEKQENDDLNIENLNVPKMTFDIEEKTKGALTEKAESNLSKFQSLNKQEVEKQSKNNLNAPFQIEFDDENTSL
ncbi:MULTISPECIES: hypothetical protein [unclassified Campylobacter]|uniref:hypothetical protein n=1 Tax=unclassified Campylobacter TaxID=2593542 RepID=UPI002B05EA1D|nr:MULTISPECIES: hypothetical protein [unclassified Campylobacter]